MTRMEIGGYVVSGDMDTKDTKKHNGHDVMRLGGSKKFHAKAQSAQRKGAPKLRETLCTSCILCGRCDPIENLRCPLITNGKLCFIQDLFC